MVELDKQYDAPAVEKKWQAFWDKEKLYSFESVSKKPVYSLDVPPPYASAGHLHIGHALHYTQFEIIARYKRMRGFNVHFAPCFDNNGLPTEKYVEEKYKISKAKTTKAEFRKLCLKESAEVEKTYSERVFKALGHSYDWSLVYTTISPEAQKVSQWSFLDLVKKGHAYRAEEPTLWCPHHQTALAQAEVENIDRNTKLNDIAFDLEGSHTKLTIATTRPEFLPACVAIFVHPDDDRYKDMVGKNAIVPLFNHKVKIMTDETVDKEFGSGIMMVCTFGDTADIDKWKKYSLDLKICVTKDGKMSDISGRYKGMTLKQAREEMLDDLKAQGRLLDQNDLQQTVGGCWRCSTPIEFLITKQWFIKTKKFKDKMIEQGEKINWYPSFYRARYNDWTNNLAWDWCISRQRFYGVPIPVWYCKKCGEAIVADEADLPVDPEVDKPKANCKCGSTEFVPEEDVFDTWMTSSMSPEISIRMLENPESFKKLFPTSLRPQSHDIIRTWAFYTILKSLLHFNEIPWKDIAIGTFVLDPKGRGMHKSKGNAIWTHEVLDKYNVDVLRYWVGGARWGEDMPYQEKDLVTGKKFLTKLWNASRFAMMQLEDHNFEEIKEEKLEIVDRWLLSRFAKVVERATKEFDVYNSSDSKKEVEQFFWHTFCDNYLEMIKNRIYNPNERGVDAKKSAQYTLYRVLLDILKMLAPIMPHITEEIYQVFYKDHVGDKSIHISSWPIIGSDWSHETSELAGDLAVEVISSCRKEKSAKNLSMKAPVKKLSITAPNKDIEALKLVEIDIKDTIKAEAVEYSEGKELKVECEF
ncbi:MAG: valine--tRNA ligase [Nanoarchaeota archaeon]|nr:valine--tRNA ligase [Nanoarchaeota archaeon]